MTFNWEYFHQELKKASFGQVDAAAIATIVAETLTIGAPTDSNEEIILAARNKHHQRLFGWIHDEARFLEKLYEESNKINWTHAQRNAIDYIAANIARHIKDLSDVKPGEESLVDIPF